MVSRLTVDGYPTPPSAGRLVCARTVLVVFAIVLGAAAARAGAPDTWYELRTRNFTVAGNVPRAELRIATDDLEAFRSALATLYPDLEAQPVSTRVVVFKDTRGFRRFLPRDDRGRPVPNVGAFFLPAPDTDFIALVARGEAYDRRAALHEYAHHALRRSGRALPLWLNEGLAEFYSTFDHHSSLAPAVLGRPPADVLAVLRSSEFVPLHTIVVAEPPADLLADGERLRVFYAEAWALVHYLLVGRPGASMGQMAAFVDALMRAVPPEDAFAAAFGVSLGQLDTELRAYARQRTFGGMRVDPGAGTTGVDTMTEMSQAAVRRLHGDLLLRVGTIDEAQRELAASLAIEPSNVEARLAMARAMLFTERRDAGLRALREIAAAAPESFAAQYYMGGVLAVQRRYLEAFWCFDAAVRLRPNSVSALYGFSSAAMALGLDDASEEAMQLSMHLEFNPESYRARAYAALGLGRDSAAARDALRYIDTVGWRDPAAQSTAFVAAVAYWRSQRPADAAAILDRVHAVVPSSSWAGAVVEFMQGWLTGEHLLSRAKDQEQRTAAHTYIGLKALLAGRRDEALGHFRWVQNEGTRQELGFGVAIEELVRIEIERRQ